MNAVLPLALTAADFGRQLAITAADPGRSVRRKVREGQLPGPINPTDSAVAWRWSPAVVAAHINPTVTA